jgi:hypothetical protein
MMNLVKIYAGSILLIALVLLSLNFFIGEGSRKIRISKGEIAPFEQWGEIIIGKWNYRAELKKTTKIHTYEGQIEYHADSTYEWNTHYKLYSYHKPGVEKIPDHLSLIAGVGRSGKWEIERHPFEENVIWWDHNSNGRCTSKITYQRLPPDSEGIYFCDDLSWEIGGKASAIGYEATRKKLLQFNGNKIIIQEQDFGSNTINYYVFKRIKD